jgi:two-component system sensor histidine kinase RegB
VARRPPDPSRPLDLRIDDTGQVAVGAPALRQGLEVLLDNAFRHGAGRVTVTVEPYGDAVLLEVMDDGPGFAPGSGQGTGLSLATDLVQRAGGSLLVRRRAPSPRVALLVPLVREGTGEPSPAGDADVTVRSGTRSP